MKVVGKASILEIYQKLSNNYSLFDSTTSVYVFYSKKRFRNFKKPATRQKLLYGKGIISIEG